MSEERRSEYLMNLIIFTLPDTSPRKSLNGVSAGRRHSWDTVKLGNHSIQWIIVVLIVVMTVCLSTLATLFFMEHYDAVRHRYYDSIAFRRLDAEQAAAAVLGKHQSIAYSHNYSTANDHVLMQGSGKPTKKGVTYKTELSGAGGSIPMSFPPPPPFPANHRPDGNGQNHNLSPDAATAAQQVNWNNLEYSFLYIYKLHQYYNELQKKVKGKLPIFGGAGGPPTASGGGERLGGGAAATGGDMMADSPSEDCDSAEPADETNLERILSNNNNNNNSNGDLKLDEEFMNRFLANILTIRNQTTTTTTEEAVVLERSANEEVRMGVIKGTKRRK